MSVHQAREAQLAQQLAGGEMNAAGELIDLLAAD